MFFNVHSNFSFQYGTMSVPLIFEEAKRYRIPHIILTDINNTAAYIELLRLVQERRQEWELKVGIGIEFREEGALRYIGLAKNDQGFLEINRFLSKRNIQKSPLPYRAPYLKHTYFIYPISNAPKDLGTHEFVGIKKGQINQVFHNGIKVQSTPDIVHDGYKSMTNAPAFSWVPVNKLIAWQPVTFPSDATNRKQCFNIHRLLRAISFNTLLSKLNPNDQASIDEVMSGQETFSAYFGKYPELIKNAMKVTRDCRLSLKLGTDKNKRFFLSTRYEDHQHLLAAAKAGYDRFYHGRQTKATDERFDKELDIIARKNFESYYLISYDIVRHARQQGYEYVGRGSGANSMIAYCLGITNTDPIELDLYFERFLNPERSSPPDFDMDFSWKDRDNIYDYIFEKYGCGHVALLGTHTTYQGRSNVRELGKVFGLPKEEIDKMLQYPKKQHFDQMAYFVFRYAELLQGMPAHISIHAGGVLITEQPIFQYTAIDVPPKGYPVTHFEMHNAEDMGIYKFDILSQRGLGHIKDTLKLVYDNQDIKEDINRFHDFKKDDRIRKLLEKGNTMGCFYVESPAMRMLLGKLACKDYLTLVAASSIIRPGVARSGMMRTYIARHHAVRNGHSYESIHPKMDELMAETYGVMVYQEDVIKVAHHFAGLTLTEADVLRRGMSGKYRSRKEFQKVRDQFFKNCKMQGYPKKVTERIWFEIESFSGYSFSKGHSASYAVESYQSLYLKAHYPLEFMVGVINNFGGFYKTEFYFREAVAWGALLAAPCVNNSRYLTGIKGETIYVGFIHIKDLQEKTGQVIWYEREKRGPFKGLDNFIRRLSIGLEQLRILIRVGAFRFTGQSKKSLLWEAQLYFGNQPNNTSAYTLDLFGGETEGFQLDFPAQSLLEDAFDELELLGFPLCDPYLLVDTENLGNEHAKSLMACLGKKAEMLGYLVTTKHTTTKDGKSMYFGTFYDSQGRVFDSVHFPQVAKKHPFRGMGFYRLWGKVVEDFGYPMLEVGKMDKLPIKQRPSATFNLNPKVTPQHVFN